MIETTAEAFHLLFSGDPDLWRIVWVSLKTGVIALLIVAPLGIVGGYFIGAFRFPGQRALIWVVQGALSFPTVLIGLLLYMLLSRRGPFGTLEWLFAQPGVVVGQVLIALPVVLALSIAAVQGADPRYAETALALGASPLRVMLTVLHEVRFSVLAGVVGGFGRIIAEVGCALMVGGNIEGQTRTITTAIALETSKGEFAQGIALGFVLIFVALFINAALMLMQGQPNPAQAWRWQRS